MKHKLCIAHNIAVLPTDVAQRRNCFSMDLIVQNLRWKTRIRMNPIRNQKALTGRL